MNYWSHRHWTFEGMSLCHKYFNSGCEAGTDMVIAMARDRVIVVILQIIRITYYNVYPVIYP